MTTLVYQAYGPDDIIDRTLFSVVSLFSVVKTASAFSIWIYTDQKKRFAEFFGDWVGGPAARIYLVGIDASQLQKWRGPLILSIGSKSKY